MVTNNLAHCQYNLQYMFVCRRLVRILTLVYEFSYQGEEEKAWEQLILCEQLIADEKDKDVQTYSQLSGALTHILQATRTHLLHRAGKTTEAKQVQYSFSVTYCIVSYYFCASLVQLDLLRSGGGF